MTTLAVLAAAVAAALAIRPASRPPQFGDTSQTVSPSVLKELTLKRWQASPWPAVAAAAVATSVLIGGLAGMVAGLVAGAAAYRWISRAESGLIRQQRAEIERDLPFAVDLLVACVAAGRSPAAAVIAVAEVMPDALGDRLREASGRLVLGADHERVWRDLAADPALAPLGHTLARSTRTGSSITTALARCADDVRRQRRARADTVARGVGVRAAAPLGACFLPAFLLIGVVPTIVGAFGAFAV
jgi:Flp pilus assembly protein TadB